MVAGTQVGASGPLGGYAAGFRDHLSEQGYAPSTVVDHVRLLAAVSGWLASRGLEAGDLTDARVEAFVRARRSAGRARLASRRGCCRCLATCATSARRSRSRRGHRWCCWSSATGAIWCRNGVCCRLRCAATWVSPAGSSRASRSSRRATWPTWPRRMSPRFVVAVSRRATAGHAKAAATRLRSLLRFVHVEGLSARELAGAVPTVASRGSALPETLCAADVAALLASCDRRRPAGCRDFAILAVLARLGLRAGEVASLRLEDVDWRRGEVTAHGKGGREDRLPLPRDVGEAIVEWLGRARPRCGCREVFTRVLAPHRALTSGGVSAVVRQACRRAGLPVVGAHRLRHFVACEMLREGGGLTEVGQLLRHRSSTASAVYAKVDRAALAAVVRPWPGAVA